MADRREIHTADPAKLAAWLQANALDPDRVRTELPITVEGPVIYLTYVHALPGGETLQAQHSCDLLVPWEE